MSQSVLTQLEFPGRVDRLEQTRVEHPKGTAYADWYRQHFEKPTAGPALNALAANAQRVVIIICDQTRPVPYHEDDRQGLLLPLVASLDAAGVAHSAITVLVALGTHVEADRASWLHSAVGIKLASSGIRFEFHDCRSNELVHLGDVTTAAGAVPVALNPALLAADLIIPTGFVEPHFMAGASGGAKLIIPGCASIDSILDTIHGPALMTHPDATLLQIEQNPLQNLFYKTVDLLTARGIPIFNVNVTMQDGKVNALFTGSLSESFLAAVEHLTSYAEVLIAEPVDLVCFQAGHITGSNLYQTAKAFFSASRILRPGGTVLLLGGMRDGLGAGDGFTDSMRLLHRIGARAYLERVCSADYSYQAEEWQTVMLARALLCGCKDEQHRFVILSDWDEQDAYRDIPVTLHRWDGKAEAAQICVDEELARLERSDGTARVAVIDDETIVPSRLGAAALNPYHPSSELPP